jgi:hypothetical protein
MVSIGIGAAAWATLLLVAEAVWALAKQDERMRREERRVGRKFFIDASGLR